MICKNCGSQLDDDAVFCPKCGSQTVSTVKTNQNEQEELIKKQKKTTLGIVVAAIVLFAIACAIVVAGMLGSKASKKSGNDKEVELTSESLEAEKKEDITSDNESTITENKTEGQEKTDERLSEDEAMSALKEIDSLMGSYIFVTLLTDEIENTLDESGSITINLTDAEKMRASVLASDIDGIIDEYFINQNNSLELYEESLNTDVEIYNGISVSRDNLEKNCINLFGISFNLDELQTNMKNPLCDAARCYVHDEAYAMQLSVMTEIETDMESRKYSIEKTDDGYKGVVELFYGYWGELKANPGYSNYKVTYDLVPCDLSEYGVVVSSMTIDWIGEQRTEDGYPPAKQNTPFYGVWCFGSTDETDALKFVETLSSSGIMGTVFVTTDWSNLNKEKYYVVSAGIYPTEEQAKDALKTVQELGYSDAYVKYSGDFLGSD